MSGTRLLAMGLAAIATTALSLHAQSARPARYENPNAQRVDAWRRSELPSRKNTGLRPLVEHRIERMNAAEMELLKTPGRTGLKRAGSRWATACS